MDNIRTLIADDHALVVQGVKHYLSVQEEMNIELIAECYYANEILEAIQTHKPDILLLDLNMPGGFIMDILKDLKSKINRPEFRIIALTAYDDPKLVKDFFNAGGDGYVLKSADISEILTAMKIVLEGKIYTGSGVKIVANATLGSGEKLVRSGEETIVTDEKRFQALYSLTKREVEILCLIANGLSNKKIAKELYISDQTVSVHRKNIMRKLNVNNIAGLVKIAYLNNLL